MILYLGNKGSITPSTIDTLGTLLQKEHSLLSCCSEKNKILRFIKMVRTLIKHKKETDLILVDTYSTWNFYYAFMTAFVAQRLQIPYVPILHGGNLPARLQKSPKLSNYIFNNSLRNITPSLYLQEYFTKADYDTQYIPNNIILEEYPHQSRQNISPKLLYVRSFAEVYNTKMAINVVKNLLKKYPDTHLCMVGPDRDGSLPKTQAYAKELGIEKHVTFTGGLSKTEWIKLSKTYDIFINTTNSDNLPVSIVEAMALGFPIVSTNAGGLPYLIENEVDGILVEKNDDIAMSQAIERLLQTPKLCEKLSQNGRKKAQSYDWNTIKNKWDTLIEDSKK